MGLEAVHSFLRRRRKIALDTSVFIYQIEANAAYVHLTHPIFKWLEQSESRAVTSTLTMTELLVHPYRSSDRLRGREFYSLLSTYPNLSWIAPHLEIADMAARIRATHRLRTPAAIQCATAFYAHATGLITNDPIFQRIDWFETLVLDSVLGGRTL